MTAATMRSARRALALLACATLAACGPDAHRAAEDAAQVSVQPAAEPARAAHVTGSPDEAATTRFLTRHWSRPLAPLGPMPAAMAGGGDTPSPERCAGCHAQQFEDWRTSLHSRAMGPGVVGQLVEMPAYARDEHQDCLRCHAPLAEQADTLAAEIAAIAARDAPARRTAGQGKDPARLHLQGLVCAACHVRGKVWYGPPRRDGSGPAGDPQALPHAGWTPEPAFEQAQFCAACHQFDDDGYALAGKPLENTLREWQATRHAREGRTCQSCHMPERRHLWRGIHDPDMVKRGVDIRADGAVADDAQVSARLRVANTGVGHHFPTYVTPRVVVRGVQIDAAGRELAGTAREFVIARQVTPDLQRELADTRIAADEAAHFDYRAPRRAGAAALAWRVEVQPDAFYLDFYRATLRDASATRGRALIERARDAAAASAFEIFRERLPLH